MTHIGNALRGILFFSAFWPSFTRIGYDARRIGWQALDSDITGQTWLVTGASAGIGREIALHASRRGARIIAVARRPEALEALRTESAGLVEAKATDLSLMANGAELAASLPRLDVLVNTVGVMFNRPTQTGEGLDAGFATNLLGHYLLTEALLQRNGLADQGVVISMTSGGAYNVPLELQPLTKLRPYDGTLAYAYHKRAQIALNSHWRQHYGDRFRFYVTHPGWVDTPGVAEAMPGFRALFGMLLRDARAGADTALWLASTRPEQRRPDGVWFDRSEQPAHLLPGTRQGSSTGELVALLERHRMAAASVPAEAGRESAATA